MQESETVALSLFCAINDGSNQIGKIDEAPIRLRGVERATYSFHLLFNSEMNVNMPDYQRAVFDDTV